MVARKSPANTTKLLVSLGYIEFDSDTWRNLKLCDVMFQKKFCDDLGWKYSITLWGYAPRPLLNRRHWAWCVELVNNEPHFVFKQEVGPIRTKADVNLFEKRAEKFWSSLECYYYERKEAE